MHDPCGRYLVDTSLDPPLGVGRTGSAVQVVAGDRVDVALCRALRRRLEVERGVGHVAEPVVDTDRQGVDRTAERRPAAARLEQHRAADRRVGPVRHDLGARAWAPVCAQSSRSRGAGTRRPPVAIQGVPRLPSVRYDGLAEERLEHQATGVGQVAGAMVVDVELQRNRLRRTRLRARVAQIGQVLQRCPSKAEGPEGHPFIRGGQTDLRAAGSERR